MFLNICLLFKIFNYNITIDVILVSDAVSVPCYSKLLNFTVTKIICLHCHVYIPAICIIIYYSCNCFTSYIQNFNDKPNAE